MQWSGFYELIVPEVGVCPQPVIDAQLRRTTIEFCETTQVWVTQLEPIPTEIGVGTYELVSPENASIVCAISQLWLNGATLPFIPLAQMRRYSTYWPQEVGDAEGYTQLAANTVTLYKAPAAVGSLNIHGILRPSIAADGIADWIGEKYFDVLVAGAKARLMAMTGVPWANPQGSTLYAGIYKGDSLAVAQERARARAVGQLSSTGGAA